MIMEINELLREKGMTNVYIFIVKPGQETMHCAPAYAARLNAFVILRRG